MRGGRRWLEWWCGGGEEGEGVVRVVVHVGGVVWRW